jgi:hypothetical protein
MPGWVASALRWIGSKRLALDKNIGWVASAVRYTNARGAGVAYVGVRARVVCMRCRCTMNVRAQAQLRHEMWIASEIRYARLHV